MSAKRIGDQHWPTEMRAARGIPFVAEQSLRTRRSLGASSYFVTATSYRRSDNRLRQLAWVALLAFIATGFVLRVTVL